MATSNNLPPQIQELLKKKGWAWPPDERLKQQIHEAMRRLSGSVKVPEELWDEVFEGIRGFEP